MGRVVGKDFGPQFTKHGLSDAKEMFSVFEQAAFSSISVRLDDFPCFIVGVEANLVSGTSFVFETPNLSQNASTLDIDVKEFCRRD